MNIKDKRLDFYNRIIEHFNSTNLAPVKGTVDKVFDNLPNHFKELDIEFLHDMQLLHDTNENWDSTGLTEVGKVSANLIKIIHIL